MTAKIRYWNRTLGGTEEAQTGFHGIWRRICVDAYTENFMKVIEIEYITSKA